MKRHIALLLLCLTTSAAWAQDTLLVDKQVFELEQFTTYTGKTIKQVRVGWEAYGQLNADKSNAILITHYFTGSSHAAGKYRVSDTTSGYWDALIGPGKAIDTNKYYVISSDTLANVSAYNPDVITTGPASINPDTGKPYGLSFPVVTIRDFVNVQKALLDSLGIQKLHAVVGPSMGSFQAIDWASAYPDKVERMISVIGSAGTDAWTSISLHHWAMPIMLDANWQQGNYYGKESPNAGLVASLMMITQQALEPDFINRTIADHSPLENAPLHDPMAEFKAVRWLRERAQSRAAQMDANHVIYLARASQAFVAGFSASMDEGLARIQAKTLFIPSAHDMLLLPENIRLAHEKLLALGKRSQIALLNGGMGHLDGVARITQQADLIRDFLNTP